MTHRSLCEYACISSHPCQGHSSLPPCHPPCHFPCHPPCDDTPDRQARPCCSPPSLMASSLGTAPSGSDANLLLAVVPPCALLACSSVHHEPPIEPCIALEFPAHLASLRSSRHKNARRRNGVQPFAICHCQPAFYCCLDFLKYFKLAMLFYSF